MRVVALDEVTFRQMAGGAPGFERAGVWDMFLPDGVAIARAEIFPGQIQWGVRIQDRAPELSDGDLLRLVARLLVWDVACAAETIDVVLGRTHAHHTLVRVGGDYV